MHTQFGALVHHCIDASTTRLDGFLSNHWETMWGASDSHMYFYGYLSIRIIYMCGQHFIGMSLRVRAVCRKNNHSCIPSMLNCVSCRLNWFSLAPRPQSYMHRNISIQIQVTQWRNFSFSPKFITDFHSHSPISSPFLYTMSSVWFLVSSSSLAAKSILNWHYCGQGAPRWFQIDLKINKWRK